MAKKDTRRVEETKRAGKNEFYLIDEEEKVKIKTKEVFEDGDEVRVRAEYVPQTTDPNPDPP